MLVLLHITLNLIFSINQTHYHNSKTLKKSICSGSLTKKLNGSPLGSSWESLFYTALQKIYITKQFAINLTHFLRKTVYNPSGRPIYVVNLQSWEQLEYYDPNNDLKLVRKYCSHRYAFCPLEITVMASIPIKRAIWAGNDVPKISGLKTEKMNLQLDV